MCWKPREQACNQRRDRTSRGLTQGEELYPPFPVEAPGVRLVVKATSRIGIGFVVPPAPPHAAGNGRDMRPWCQLDSVDRSGPTRQKLGRSIVRLERGVSFDVGASLLHPTPLLRNQLGYARKRALDQVGRGGTCVCARAVVLDANVVLSATSSPRKTFPTAVQEAIGSASLVVVGRAHRRHASDAAETGTFMQSRHTLCASLSRLVSITSSPGCFLSAALVLALSPVLELLLVLVDQNSGFPPPL
jgi:hypothetical protein